MTRAICSSCCGTREGAYLEPISYSTECRVVIAPCRSCHGTGVESYPTTLDMRTARIALEKAIMALDQTFGKRRAV